MFWHTTATALLASAASAASSNYLQNGADWGSTNEACKNKESSQQSPINIDTSAGVTASTKTLLKGTGYFNPWMPDASITNEQPWKVTFADQQKVKDANLQLTFEEGTVKNYQPKQFHFHAPSEHRVDGTAYDLEVHFVHKDANSESPETYGAVVGIFFDGTAGGSTENAFLKDFIASIEAGKKAQLDVKGLMSATKGKGFWSYPGSLTTPPCSEGIKWNVMQKVHSISEAQLAFFKKKLTTANGFKDGNFRAIQPLNGRTVYQNGAAQVFDFVDDALANPDEVDGAIGVTTYAVLVVAAVAALF